MWFFFLTLTVAEVALHGLKPLQPIPFSEQEKTGSEALLKPYKPKSLQLQPHFQPNEQEKAVISLVQNKAGVTAGGWENVATETGAPVPAYPGNQPTILRYGYGTDWHYWFADNGAITYCHNEFYSDPAPGYGKSCQRKLVDTTSGDLNWPKTNQWRLANSENGWLGVPAGCVAWVYYGTAAPGSGRPGFYHFQQDSQFCTNEMYRDPAPGSAKQCWMSLNCVPFSETSICASENQYCDMSDSGAPYRLLTIKGAQRQQSQSRLTSKMNTPCVWDLFNYDVDAYGAKTCSYQDPKFFLAPVGYWSAIGSGYQYSKALTVGYTHTSTTSTTKSWSLSLTQTIESGCIFGSSSFSTTQTFETSSTFEDAAQQSASATCMSQCPPGFSYMYQWKLTAKEVCAPSDASCQVDLGTCNFVCRPSMTPPPCPLGYCIDDPCSSCISTFNPPK